MPTYSYKCEEGHEFEVWQKITEEPLAECPHWINESDEFEPRQCKAKVSRQINFQGGIIKLGSGWTPKFH